MWIIFLCLFAGFLMGWLRLLPQRILVFTGQGMTVGVVFLLFTMGLRLGVDHSILSQLGRFGLQALLYSSLSVLMSLVGVYVLESIVLTFSITGYNCFFNQCFSRNIIHFTGSFFST